MKFLHIILAAFVVILSFSAIRAADEIGPCVDKIGADMCKNLIQDCNNPKWQTLIQGSCRATCGVCK
uniref:ShKT domain-containing protein n=1 Tax=Panagrolaimus sp. PS1159 TaxID=55785 RepID=A0AC35FKU9_9BILA